MSAIVVADMPKRGFRILGSENDKAARMLRDVSTERGYEAETSEGSIWVRYAPRRDGSFPRPYLILLKATRVKKSIGDDMSWLNSLDSRYDPFVKSFPNFRDCEALLEGVQEKPDCRLLHACLSLC